MKKLKNKFIIGVIFLIVAILFSQILRAYSSSSVDTNTYLSLLKGKATINENFLRIDEQTQLFSGDIVRTIGKESLALIQWGDGSITRLGGNTKISVGNNEVSRDFTKIDISFDLLAGKTWSNIVSFISSDSSFTQNFTGIEAGVRGTVFDVNLEELFINVSSHQVALSGSDGQEIIISEGKPFSLETLSFINPTVFLNTLRDTQWQELNLDLDTDQLSQLKEQIELHLDSHNPFSFLLDFISPGRKFLAKLDAGTSYDQLVQDLENMNDGQLSTVYNSILSRYQKLNFVSSDDTQNYDTKILYKRLLISLSDTSDKKRLLETTLYDFKDTISTQNIPSFNSTLELLNENKEILKTLDIQQYLGSINLIPDDLEAAMRESFQDIQGFVEGGSIDTQQIDFSGVTDIVDGGVENVGKNISDAEKKARESIEQGLDSIFDSFTN